MKGKVAERSTRLFIRQVKLALVIHPSLHMLTCALTDDLCTLSSLKLLQQYSRLNSTYLLVILIQTLHRKRLVGQMNSRLVKDGPNTRCITSTCLRTFLVTPMQFLLALLALPKNHDRSSQSLKKNRHQRQCLLESFDPS